MVLKIYGVHYQLLIKSIGWTIISEYLLEKIIRNSECYLRESYKVVILAGNEQMIKKNIWLIGGFGNDSNRKINFALYNMLIKNDANSV